MIYLFLKHPKNPDVWIQWLFWGLYIQPLRNTYRFKQTLPLGSENKKQTTMVERIKTTPNTFILRALKSYTNTMHGQTQEMICYRPLQSRWALWLLPERVLLYACIVTPAKWVSIEHRLFQFTTNPTTIIKKMLQHFATESVSFKLLLVRKCLFPLPKRNTKPRNTFHIVEIQICKLQILRSAANLLKP